MAKRLDIKDVTIIMPAYNEAEGIGATIAELIEAIPQATILVVDDGSHDDTASIAESAGATVLRHCRNRGYGAALKTGIRTVRTPYVAMYDADGQHRPEDLITLVDRAGEYDIVIGARGSDSHRPLLRRPGKWLLKRIINALVGQKIPDFNSGLRVIRRDVILRYLHLLPNGFSASATTTICMLQRGYEVCFSPITVRKRAGSSTVGQLRDGWNTISLVVRLIILFNPRRFFLPPAVALIGGGVSYGFLKAVFSGQGVPTLALLAVTTGLITAMFGLLADQISTLRIELFENEGNHD